LYQIEGLRNWGIEELKNKIKKMNFPAASHGVSMKDKFNLIAASCGELNLADFASSTPHSL
jgi:hypothetical protein